jgi:hypothetical protein
VAQGGGDTYEKLEVACFILAPLVKGKHVPAPILRAVADILNLPK